MLRMAVRLWSVGQIMLITLVFIYGLQFQKGHLLQCHIGHNLEHLGLGNMQEVGYLIQELRIPTRLGCQAMLLILELGLHGWLLIQLVIGLHLRSYKLCIN